MINNQHYYTVNLPIIQKTFRAVVCKCNRVLYSKRYKQLNMQVIPSFVTSLVVGYCEDCHQTCIRPIPFSKVL